MLQQRFVFFAALGGVMAIHRRLGYVACSWSVNCFETIFLEAAFNEHVANSVLLKAQETNSGNRSISPDAMADETLNFEEEMEEIEEETPKVAGLISGLDVCFSWSVSDILQLHWSKIGLCFGGFTYECWGIWASAAEAELRWGSMD